MHTDSKTINSKYLRSQFFFAIYLSGEKFVGEKWIY